MQEVKLIDANALKDRIDSAFTTYGECTYVKGIIDAQPTIEPKRGEWTSDDLKGKYICSACGKGTWRGFGVFDFCPNCGAKMDGGADNG
jgi:hypothetical protein